MGIFDLFLSEEQRIQKHQRTLTNRDVQPEDRETSARWLADNGSGKALVALLTRFDMNLENQLKDKGEKDFVYSLLSAIGEPVLRPLERHLERCRQIALPIRMYVEMKGEEAAILKAYDLLALERSKDDFKPEKKTDLLVWLAERRHAGAITAVQPSLDDFDEGVRCAAAEVIIAQGDEAGRDPLVKRMTHPEEDSNRLRVRLAGLFAERGWAVDADAITPFLPEGFSVRNGRVVQG